MRGADAAGEPVLVLAGGSNVVIADAGFDGLVVHVATTGVRREPAADGRERLTVAAGEPWDDVVAGAVAEGLAGIECLSGIPGSTGATPIQNVGAYGQEVASTIASVRVLDRRTGAVEELAPEACGFAYRSSAFKRVSRSRRARGHVRARALSSVGAAALRRAGAQRWAPSRAPERRCTRSARPCSRCGAGRAWCSTPPTTTRGARARSSRTRSSTPRRSRRSRTRAGAAPPRFPEPDGRIKTSAAWLIERAGFTKGDARGPVALSSKHALALTNRGGATAEQLVGFAREIAGQVEQRLGVALVPEPVLVGPAVAARRLSWRAYSSSSRAKIICIGTVSPSFASGKTTYDTGGPPNHTAVSASPT